MQASNPFDQFDATPPSQQTGNPFDQFDATPAQKPEISPARTALDQGMQGATFGFADEVTDPLGATIAALRENPMGFAKAIVTGKTPEVSPELSDEIANVRNASKERMGEEWRQHPLLSLGSNLTGGMLTSAALASTAPGAAVANSLGTGGTLARIGKGAAMGAASGGLYGAGSADDGNRLQGAQQGALIGGAIGGAIPAVGAAASALKNGAQTAFQGITARSPEVLQDTAQAMKSGAGGIYNQIRDSGVTLGDDTTQKLVAGIDDALQSKKFIPALNPKTVAIVDDLKQEAANGPLSLDMVDQYRRLLGRVGASEDGVSAGSVRQAIDSVVNTLPEADKLNFARSEYGKAMRFGDIADIVSGAAGDANKLKSGLTRFLNNPSNTAGWADAEIEALKTAANQKGSDAILKGLGRFGFSPKNVFMPIVGSGAATAAFGGPAGVGLAAAGTAARGLRGALASGNAENLLNTIANGAGPAAGNAITPLASGPAGEAAAAIRSIPAAESPAAAIQRPAMQMPSPQPQDTLFQRVIQQESGGKQSAISNKGAIGVAQIMPQTAPDAAKAAGLPYDPFKLRTDPQYNAALGQAYLGQMRQKYGDDTLALMAYNWGPGNVDMWLKSGADPKRIPRETRQYVSNILEGL